MNRRVRLYTSAAVLAVILAGHAQAQTASPSAAEASETATGDIVVTGSRIKAPGQTGSGPLLSVSSEELALQGTTSAETLLNNLPQVTASNSSNQSTFGTPGIATVNLRDLGPARTLVLIDGRRLMPGDPNQPFADINFIPTALVSSVEVLTGGASATYGSDAVAGVVNFKLKRDLNGVLFDYQFSGSEHANDDGAMHDKLRAFGVDVPGSKFGGQTHNLMLAGGMNTADGKGNVTAFLGYRDADPIAATARDFAACGLGTTSGANPFDTHACAGSSTSAFGRFRTNGSGTGFAANPDGSATFVPYGNNLAFNSPQGTYLQRSDKRYSAGLFGHYEASRAFDVYGEFLFMDDSTRAQLAPGGITSGHTYTINCDNPLLSAAQATQLCDANAGSATANWQGTIGKRLVVPGRDRYYGLRHTDYRMVGGVRGQIGGGWSYDVSVQHGIVDYRNDQIDDVSVSRVQDALLVRNVNGIPACISGAAGCAPLNIFQLGKLDAAAADYVLASGEQHGTVEQTVLSGTVNGDLAALGLQSPWAGRAISVALGAEYRRDSIRLTSSPNILNGDLAGFGGTAPAQGSTHVGEFFAEALIPIATDRPLMHDLSLDAAYRYSDYNLAGGASTYRFSLNWAPSADLRFRGGFNRAVRAPNVVELFAPQSRSSASVTDACAGANPTASLAQCANTGVTQAQYGTIAECSSNFCTTLAGGNLALKPETADTYTAGLVLTPRAIPGLLVSVDYFNIKVSDLIGTVPVPLAFSQCLSGGDPFYCSLIQRDANGSLATENGYIVATNVNTGFLKTSGLDVAGSYRLGTFSLGLTGTWTHDRQVSPLPGQPSYDCAGLFGPTCGVPTPEWRHNARLTWEMPGKATLSFNWRYIGPSTVDINQGNPVFSGVTGGARDIADARIKPVSYFDLSGNVAVLRNFTLRAGITNLFDKAPPLVDNFNLGVNAQFGNGNTFPGLYDVLGRTFFAGISAKF